MHIHIIIMQKGQIKALLCNMALWGLVIIETILAAASAKHSTFIL